MGDTGSLIVGVVVALITIHFIGFTPVSSTSVYGSSAIALAIIIVPVVDTIRVFAIRISHGRSPFPPDMNHIHHNILKLTGSHLASSLIIIAVNGLIILLSFLLIDEIGNNLLFCILLITGFILASIPAYILKWQKINNTTEEKDKSIFALSIFIKRRKN